MPFDIEVLDRAYDIMSVVLECDECGRRCDNVGVVSDLEGWRLSSFTGLAYCPRCSRRMGLELDWGDVLPAAHEFDDAD